MTRYMPRLLPLLTSNNWTTFEDFGSDRNTVFSAAPCQFNVNINWAVIVSDDFD
jgi:hypothetical protein